MTNVDVNIPASDGGNRDDCGFTTVRRLNRRRNLNGNRAMPITGRKEGNSLSVVPQVRKCRIFVSRLCPTVTSEVIKTYVDSMVGADCQVEKLSTKFPTYSSFVVTTDITHKEKLLDENEWENGVIIRTFYGQVSKEYPERGQTN